MSRIISGKLRMDVQRVELVGIIDAAIESVRPAAEAKGVQLVKLLDPAGGSVMGDPSRLQQIVWNLLSNAVKFTPKGGSVHTRLTQADGHVDIEVSDTGQGISPSFCPTSSNVSARPTPRPPAATPGWVWVWPSSAIWSNCTAAR